MIMEIRLATENDLPELKTMFGDIVNNMNNMGITIWDEVYPYEVFIDDIDDGTLYVLVDDNEIIATLGLFNSNDAEDCFNWNNKESKAMYVGRVGVKVDHLRKGVGSVIVNKAKEIAKQNGAEYLRLLVATINEPATNLYLKHGFKKVSGESKEYSEKRDLYITEYGYELKL
jgi:ribosomal protein S18 acetylase RimI-like enzyme